MTSPHRRLVVIHDYTDDELLRLGGMNAWSAANVAQAQASHGVPVVEAALIGGKHARTAGIAKDRQRLAVKSERAKLAQRPQSFTEPCPLQRE